MRANGLGCGGWIGAIIIIVVLWNIVGCIVGKVWDGVQEVLAERHARQEVADARARERLTKEMAETAESKAKAAAARRAEAEEIEQRRREETLLREMVERKAAADKREAVRLDKLRTFALQDAPDIWRAYQQLKSAISEQNIRINDLAATLGEFDKDPEADVDYKVICAARGEMEESLKDVRNKLEEAYLSSCRFKATPSHKEYADLMRKALEDGMRVADAATRKFEKMKIEK